MIGFREPSGIFEEGHGQMKDTGLVRQLGESGYCILPSVFDAAAVAVEREACLNARPLMGQTRNVDHAYHLAGFHRFQSLMGLHTTVATHERVQDFLAAYYGPEKFYAIGLSDITINRSQQWHTDLLRGKFSSFLPEGVAWNRAGASCIKVLVYLQPGKSLRIVPGSHLGPTPLDDAELEKHPSLQNQKQMELNVGDVVMMDIRALHRGSTDEEMKSPELAKNPKVLVSTVFGAIKSEFAQAMQLGNAHRMMGWDAKFLSADSI